MNSACPWWLWGHGCAGGSPAGAVGARWQGIGSSHRCCGHSRLWQGGGWQVPTTGRQPPAGSTSSGNGGLEQSGTVRRCCQQCWRWGGEQRPPAGAADSVSSTFLQGDTAMHKGARALACTPYTSPLHFSFAIKKAPGSERKF